MMKKGFTLIELLAVIIVLSVVAIIATPKVLNVIDEAKASTNKSSAYGILDSAKLYYAESMFDNIKSAKVSALINIYNEVITSGKKPENGELYVNSNGSTALSIIIDNKCYKKEFVGELTVSEDATCTLNYSGNDKAAPAVSFAVLGTPFNANGWSKSDFYISIAVSDTESGPANYKWCSDSKECTPSAIVDKATDAAFITTESAGNVVCVIGYDLAGNPSPTTCSTQYKLDKTAPIPGTINLSGTIGSNDWYTTNVNISKTDGTDALSGHASTNIDVSNVTSNTSLTNITLETKDVADNSATTSTSIKVDKDAPVLSANTEAAEITEGTNNASSSYFTASYGLSGSGNLVCTPNNTASLVAGTSVLSCTATGSNGLTATTTKNITIHSSYNFGTDTSGANTPTLYTNMKPVVYDVGTASWVYASTNQINWYNYNNKQWANAVVLISSPSKTYAVGDSILMSDIAQMYVWIPRYKYMLFNSTTPMQIAVTFESGTAKTGTISCSDSIANQVSYSQVCGAITYGSSTFTHPAFTLGSTELRGIWFGKFENSNLTACTAANLSVGTGCDISTMGIQIKPNVISWRGARVSTFFTTTKNIAGYYGVSNADSHMMRNMEWGAVAYLSQSKYGRCTSGTCPEIGINNNSSFKTGCGAVAKSSAVATCDEYNTTNGKLASTTGNVYGIYDMSGGGREYAMGNIALSSSSMVVGSDATYTSGFAGVNYLGTALTGITFPASKYTDVYSYFNAPVAFNRGKLGDATKETKDGTDTATSAWYSNSTVFPSGTYPWFVRGGAPNGPSEAGLFNFYYHYGSSGTNISSRSVITSN